MRPLLALVAGLLIAWMPVGRAAPLQPFVATYEAWYQGRQAGTATMRLQPDGPNWQIDLGIRGNRGFAGILGLNVEQGTRFDLVGETFRPLTQHTLRKAAVLFNRRTEGVYDWTKGVATWTGDISKRRRAPVPLQPGDMSALLINLAIVRDAAPGAALQYRFVDGGRARDYAYLTAPEPEIIQVADVSYSALRVSRTNGGNDEMIVWIADGVPTPIRILQREDGEDAIDLRLVEYQGVP
ncbi:DUF3108 domain-containing protein [Luteimonas sp. S4-F44]|uniref:DUF3108 domain-containing protein n=1 Tax=Luteimonas sp. S4-F44 TaxID=2925842 RepID=UPI001F52F4AE|nr:DUF3108 domain-containing protein [Luteimonas sp. S4-F44]UNK43297.1 DUF3108 domain-containing protein [Luteimonas sp. S4-F44]